MPIVQGFLKSRRQTTLLLVLAVLAGASAWALWGAVGVDASRYPGANVVLISIDTMRTDRLGAYGYEGADTPRIDGLARDGIRFEQVVSPMPLTLPAHTSLMTALSTPAHGVRDNGAFELAAEDTTLAEQLRQAGYAGGAFVGSFVLHSRWGLERGFDHYDDNFEYEQPGGIPGQVERRAEAVVDAAIGWLREPREAPFFAWIHLYDPHSPYAAPEPYASRFADRPYDGEVAYTDAQIGRLIDELDGQGVLDDTVLVLTADHGEGLGEHDEPGHGMFLYDTTVLVPLIIRAPDGARAGRAVVEQVRLIDVAPTILELVDVEIPTSFVGASLEPFFAGEAAPRAAYSETYYPLWHFGWQELRALRKDGFKYIQAPREELYDLGSDPDELRNIAADQPSRAAALESEVEDLRGEPAQAPGALSAEASARLRALGYIGNAPADVPAGPLPDPKDKIHLFTRTTEGQGLLAAGELTEAVEVLRGVVEEDPRISSAWVTLGNAQFRLGRFADAAASFREAVRLAPQDHVALVNLGLAHRRLGDPEAARADFEAVLTLDPSNTSARFNLGEMTIESGDAARAKEHFEAAARINDQLPGPHFGLGVAAYQVGDIAAARRAFDRVEELAPRYLELNYYRALIAESADDPQAATKLYRAELDNNPGHHRSWLNLSQLQAQAGDHAAAVASLRRAVETDPERAPAHVLLARSLLALERPDDYPEAEAEARRGLALDPPAQLRALAHYVLADIYNRLGRPEEAQREVALARQAERAIGREQ